MTQKSKIFDTTTVFKSEFRVLCMYGFVSIKVLVLSLLLRTTEESWRKSKRHKLSPVEAIKERNQIKMFKARSIILK